MTIFYEKSYLTGQCGQLLDFCHCRNGRTFGLIAIPCAFVFAKSVGTHFAVSDLYSSLIPFWPIFATYAIMPVLYSSVKTQRPW